MSTIDFTNLFNNITGGGSSAQSIGATATGAAATQSARTTKSNTVADARHIQAASKSNPATGGGTSSPTTSTVSSLFAEFDDGNPFTNG